MRPSSKKQPKLPCLNCWERDQKCERGTLKGCCVGCNLLGQAGVDFSEPFCNNALYEFMLDLARTTQLASIASDEIIYNYLLIRSHTSRGSYEDHGLDIHGYFASFNDALVSAMDCIVQRFYIPAIRAAGVCSPLIARSLLCRGYLCLLFSNTIVSEENRNWQGIGETYRSGNELAQHLMIFILGRLDSLLSEVLSCIAAKPLHHSQENVLDTSAAAGLLYAGLMYASRGLETRRLLPICGGPPLAHMLHQRIASVAEKLVLHQRPNCSAIKNWAEHIAEPWEKLRANVEIHSMTLILERRYYTTSTSHDTLTNLSSSLAADEAADISFGERFSSSDTSQSTDREAPPNIYGASQVLGWRTSFYVGKADIYDLPRLASGKMTSQDSGYLGFGHWNEWPEQFNVTRSQF